MTVMPFIPKEDAKLPDHYGMKMFYLDGKMEEFELASHRLGSSILEFVTRDDVWHWIPLTAIKRVEFDKRFSTIVAIKNANKT